MIILIVFYHLTYEGAVDMEKVTDPLERESLEAQINEFGQTPKQLFDVPHPKKVPKVLIIIIYYYYYSFFFDCVIVPPNQNCFSFSWYL